jgi:mxaL protein
MQLRHALADRWFIGLAAVALLLASALFEPRWPGVRPVWAHLFIVDITRSMNTEDYSLHGRPVSRLAYVKEILVQTLAGLPCGSQAGVGVYTERNSTILVMPVEVCANFGALEQTVRKLDWRMAWAADSNIGRGLYNTLKLMMDVHRRGLIPAHTNLVFMTDGHEAPPVNPRYEPDFTDLSPDPAAVVPGAVRMAAEHQAQASAAATFEGEKGAIPGVVVGVGGHGLTPIPRYRADGSQDGFYEQDQVQQATRFGEPTAAQRASISGYEARNAPWGGEAASGNEHYSSVREEHLRTLASASGLEYHHLQGASDFAVALAQPERAIPIEGSIPLRPALLLAALLLFSALLLPFVLSALRDAPRKVRPRREAHTRPSGYAISASAQSLDTSPSRRTQCPSAARSP